MTNSLGLVLNIDSCDVISQDQLITLIVPSNCFPTCFLGAPLSAEATGIKSELEAKLSKLADGISRFASRHDVIFLLRCFPSLPPLLTTVRFASSTTTSTRRVQTLRWIRVQQTFLPRSYQVRNRLHFLLCLGIRRTSSLILLVFVASAASTI